METMKKSDALLLAAAFGVAGAFAGPKISEFMNPKLVVNPDQASEIRTSVAEGDGRCLDLAGALQDSRAECQKSQFSRWMESVEGQPYPPNRKMNN